MTDAKTAPAPGSHGASGWVEAGCFVLALTALNLTYAAGHASGVHPVAFLVYAMLSAAFTLLVITGPGTAWRAVVTHPLSWVIGAGIIGMEATYYMLLRYVSPADGSILIRLNLPVSMLAAWLFLRRRSPRLAVLGGTMVAGFVGWFVSGVEAAVIDATIALSLSCALISVTRNFSAELHPHNRAARTVWEKMRVTGLMLLVTSMAGTAFVVGLMVLTAQGTLPEIAAIPKPEAFMHLPTILLAAFMGCLVLTAMQYFGFSSVVKIGTENFIAANSLIPVTTLVAQHAVAAVGWMPVAPVDSRFAIALVGMLAGVTLYLIAARLRR